MVWTADHAEELGIDASRLIIAGGSAGGGIAAGVTLMARDRKGSELLGSVLIYPMIDDRNQTVSSHQIDGEGIWDRGSNDTGWDALLGDRRKTDAVSIYAAPSRASDLSRLPPTFIDVATAAHLNDAMLLERFAIAVAITLSRAGSDSGEHRAAELVVDASAPADDRASAAARLRLEPHTRVRAIALRPAHASSPGIRTRCCPRRSVSRRC